jgi:hypothetical protein
VLLRSKRMVANYIPTESPIRCDSESGRFPSFGGQVTEIRKRPAGKVLTRCDCKYMWAIPSDSRLHQDSKYVFFMAIRRRVGAAWRPQSRTGCWQDTFKGKNDAHVRVELISTIKNLFSVLRCVPWSSRYGGRKLLCGRKAAAAPTFMQTAISDLSISPPTYLYQ